MKVNSLLAEIREDGDMLVAYTRTPGGFQCRICFLSKYDEAHQERTRWDPRDDELNLVRTKSGETLMEVRRDSDVQIDLSNWA